MPVERDETRKDRTDRKKRRGKGPAQKAAAFISLLGTLLLILLVLVCLPLMVPRFFGYHIYSVVSGSMEPAIPTGSLVYIHETPPEDVAQEEVIAFYGARDSASIITHRVVENRVLMGEFITKGDANQTEDMNPVPYGNFIGKVVYFLPGAGRAAELFTSSSGKILAGGVIAAALVLQVLAAAIGAAKHDDRRR